MVDSRRWIDCDVADIAAAAAAAAPLHHLLSCFKFETVFTKNCVCDPSPVVTFPSAEHRHNVGDDCCWTLSLNLNFVTYVETVYGFLL